MILNDAIAMEQEFLHLLLPWIFVSENEWPLTS